MIKILAEVLSCQSYINLTRIRALRSTCRSDSDFHSPDATSAELVRDHKRNSSWFKGDKSQSSRKQVNQTRMKQKKVEDWMEVVCTLS